MSLLTNRIKNNIIKLNIIKGKGFMYRYFLARKLHKNSYIYRPVMDSTYLYAKKHFADLNDRFTIISKRQTHGVGRTGKSFISNSGNGVYFTVIIKNAKELKHITCAAAVCAVRVIKKLYGKDTKIKWVNDIMLGDKKVCGILAGLPGESDTVILGVGVNIAPPKGGFAPEISDVAAAVKNTVSSKEKAEFIAEYLLEFDRIFSGEFMSEYIALSYNVGKNVTFTQNGKTVNGRCTAVNRDGSIRIADGDNVYDLSFGEVSVAIVN